MNEGGRRRPSPFELETGRDPSPRRGSKREGTYPPPLATIVKKVVTIIVPEFAYNKLNPNKIKHELTLHNKK